MASACREQCRSATDIRASKRVGFEDTMEMMLPKAGWGNVRKALASDERKR